jgi:hypothetical protein
VDRRRTAGLRKVAHLPLAPDKEALTDRDARLSSVQAGVDPYEGARVADEASTWDKEQAMKPTRIILTTCTAGLLVLCACTSEKTSSPLSLSSDATASSMTSDTTRAGDQNQPGPRPPRLGVPGPLDNDRIPQGGTYDPATGRFVVTSETDEHGATISRAYAFLDAAGAPQTAYDESLTASISVRFTLDAHPSRDGHTGTIHVEHELTASGLEGAETTRTWNGTMTERTEGVPPMGGPGGPSGPGGPGGPDGSGGPGGERGENGPPAGSGSEAGPIPPDGGFDPTNMKTNVTSAIHDVVMPCPLGDEAWPLSGSITRVEHMEGGPNGTEDRTSVLTFNGTRYATLTAGGKAARIDLKDPRPPKPPRP